MNKKYEFTGETIDWMGRTLFRIRALCSFGTVVKGELGGFIESGKNLALSGAAWVSGDAKVSGDAEVFGDAQVSGAAWVSGAARVFGDAKVFGDARVFGDAQVSGAADFFLLGPIGSRRAFLTIHGDENIGIRVSTGCFSGSVHEFESAVTKTHGGSKYEKQYRAAIALALLMVKPSSKKIAEAA